MDCRVKPGNDELRISRVIARSDSDEAIQYGTSGLDCFADARNDDANRSRGAKASELCDHEASSNTQPLARKKARGAERQKTHPTNVRRANMRAQRAPLVCVRGGGAPQKTSLAQRLCLRGALASRRTAAALVRALTS